jgi:hypothetical protein
MNTCINRFGSLVVAFWLVGCGSSDPSTAAPAAGGTGGSAAGTGGSAAGTGGSAAGTGGSAAGTGGSAAGTGGSAAGTGGSAAGTGGSAGASACSTLTNDAPGVPESAGVGTIPTMTGGTIADGIYVASERLDFSGGTCGCTTHTKVKISGGGTLVEAVSRTDPMKDAAYSGTMSTSSNMMTWDFTCPANMALVVQYTAQTGSFQTLDNQMQVETFTAQ